MADYWLDTNVFITSKDGYYPFDLVPGFWNLIDEKAKEGVIASSTMVYDELVEDREDDLAQWARDRRSLPLFVEPDMHVQIAFRDIADYVQQRYLPPNASDFLDGADPWLIAHAKIYGGKVVTLERHVGDNSQQVKIPNICEAFDVPWIRLIPMLREIGASFS